LRVRNATISARPVTGSPRLRFAGPACRGCAWINASGELGSSSSAVASVVRDHKRGFHAYRRGLARAAVPHDSASQPLADAVCLLAEGAIVTAGIDQDAQAAVRARETAAALLRIR
jgi:hypothetical protein